MKPIQHERSKGKTIFLEGTCYYPAGDELSAKFQRNAAKLKNGSQFTVDFENVTSIDAGAAVGIVDGIQFSLDTNSTLIVCLTNIEVNLCSLLSTTKTIQKDKFVNQLELVGLPKNVLINGKPQINDFDMSELDSGSTRKRITTSTVSL